MVQRLNDICAAVNSRQGLCEIAKTLGFLVEHTGLGVTGNQFPGFLHRFGGFYGGGGGFGVAEALLLGRQPAAEAQETE